MGAVLTCMLLRNAFGVRYGVRFCSLGRLWRVEKSSRELRESVSPRVAG